MLRLKRKNYSSFGTIRSGISQQIKGLSNHAFTTGRYQGLTGAQRFGMFAKGTGNVLKGTAGLALKTGAGALALGGLGLAGIHSMATDG
jgi:hypothetical protein